MLPPATDTVQGATDAELLAAHLAGDPTAFGRMAQRHFRRLHAVAVRTLDRPDDAPDAVQEALIAALRRAHTYRGEASVSTWLARIVVNTCIDRLRRDKARPCVPFPDLDRAERRPDPSSEVTTRLTVDSALRLLPDEQRLAVVLVDVEGWPVAEVARLLEVPVGTVKSRCSRGRARLAGLLGHLREGER